jgi:hypothetical protein
MEKRRVRIYKAGGQSGSYINKTAKYFQDGGMQTGQEQMQPTQELTDNQVINIILQRLSKEDGTGDIQYAKQELSQMNIAPERIDRLSNYVLNYVDDEKALEAAQQTGDDETAAKLQAEEDANRQQAEEELAAEQEQQSQQQLQDIYNDNSASEDDGSYDQAEADIVMRNGGMPSKKAFINNYMKLAKKQKGGDTEEFKSDLKTDIPIGGRERKVFDFQNALKSSANNAALRQQAEKAYAQEGGSMFPEQNEDPENPMHHIGAYATGIHDIFDNPQVGTSSGPEQLQFGGWGHGKERRAARRLNRMMPQGFNPMHNPFMQSQMSNLTQFTGENNLGLANIDVRRTGLFGRPKEYTINFNTVTPITQKDIEDTRKRVIVNVDEAINDIDNQVKEDATNTSTEKNAEVQNANATTVDAESVSTVTDQVKSNSGKDLSGGTDSFETIDGADIAPPVNKVKKSLKDGLYSYKDTDALYRKKGNTWYINRGEQTNMQYVPIKDPTGARTKELNLNATYIGDPVTSGRVPTFGMSNSYSPAIDPITGQYRSMSAGEDDQTMLDLITLGLGTRAKGVTQGIRSGLEDFAFKPTAKGFLNAGKNMLNPGQNMLSPGQGMMNPGQGLLNPPGGFQYNLPFQQGGFTDQESGLYKFMGGGEDMAQADLDYTNSKNISSPYFEDGGYFQTAGQTDNTPVEILDTNGKVVRKGTLAEAERAGLNHRVITNAPAKTTKQTQQTPVNYNNRSNPYIRQRGNAYMTGTNNPYMGQLGPNAQIRSIDVTKSRMFGRGPKEFTINYNVPGQPGIHASNSPKSYKGSDGQIHWMGSEESIKSSGKSQQRINPETNRPETRERPLANMLMKSRIPGLMNVGARMYPWEAIPTDETVWTNTNINQGPAYSNVPSQGIIPFVNDQLNVDLNRQPYVSPALEFGENAPYNPDMINMQNYYDFTGPEMAYGGYIPRAQFGTQQDSQEQTPFTGIGTGDIPIGYFKDPKTGVIKNLAGDIYSPKTNLQGKSDKLMNANTPNSMNYQKNELTGEKSALQMGTDGNYVNTGVLTDKDKEAGAMQQVSQNFGIDNQSGNTGSGTDKLDKFNAIGNAFAGFMERGEDKRQEAKMADRFNANNLYTTTNAIDRGTYDQEGRFKLDEEGFTGVARYGGYMEEGGSYEEGGDTWMSEEQIQKFLAEGGELEFV